MVKSFIDSSDLHIWLSRQKWNVPTKNKETKKRIYTSIINIAQDGDDVAHRAMPGLLRSPLKTYQGIIILFPLKNKGILYCSAAESLLASDRRCIITAKE